MSQNPLERAIEEIKKKKIGGKSSFDTGSEFSTPRDYRRWGYDNAIDDALLICQRILDDSRSELSEDKSCEPAPKMRWEITGSVNWENKNEFLNQGWQPLTVIMDERGDEYVYFKRLVPCEKE